MRMRCDIGQRCGQKRACGVVAQVTAVNRVRAVSGGHGRRAVVLDCCSPYVRD